jgi:hypothetical protein
MSHGRVYLWTPDVQNDSGGTLRATIVPLPNLDENGEGKGHLWGRFVRVKNGGAINEPDELTGDVKVVQIGNAAPDEEGNFIFEQGHGGGRLDKVLLADPEVRHRYIQASHFGEVNTYFHIDRIAAYVDELLHDLNGAPLPKVTVIVNAHHAATEHDGLRDGVRGTFHWLPFQGGHYRLPNNRLSAMPAKVHYVREFHPISIDGEIHLGPGQRLLSHGALVDAAGGRYRANASHNPGVIYHEYGHHISRHTADFRANALLPNDQQDNRKISLDEGIADYWAATLLNTPHLWLRRLRRDGHAAHTRSLIANKTMVDYVRGPMADSHANGTIWASALWDLRTVMAEKESDDVRRADLLVLKSLLLLGKFVGTDQTPTVKSSRSARKSFSAGLAALLQADELLFAGRYHDVIIAPFSTRGIKLEKN